MKLLTLLLAGPTLVTILASVGAGDASVAEWSAIGGQSTPRVLFDDPLPTCVDCTFSLFVDKEKHPFENACWETNNAYPFRYYDYKCKRFSCNNMKWYYLQMTPTPGGCVNTELIPNPVCPVDSCAPTI
ncbi:MAG: hypothetical protein ACAH95_02455 [Fimbriimonas sp.]